MKSDGTKILAGAAVIAVIILFVAYKFFYSSDVEKAQNIENENKNLQARVDELNGKMVSRTLFEEKIRLSDDVIKSVFEKYGPGITPEKTIMQVVELCQKVGCSIDTVTFSDPSSIYTSEDVDENGTPKNKLLQSSTNLTILSGYTQLKKVVDFVNYYHGSDGKPERMNIENFSITYDQQSGRLKTTMTINLYAAEDEYHTYIAPEVKEMEMGSSNIFKNFEDFAEEVSEEESEDTVEAGEKASAKKSETVENADSNNKVEADNNADNSNNEN